MMRMYAKGKTYTERGAEHSASGFGWSTMGSHTTSKNVIDYGVAYLFIPDKQKTRNWFHASHCCFIVFFANKKHHRGWRLKVVPLFFLCYPHPVSCALFPSCSLYIFIYSFPVHRFSRALCVSHCFDNSLYFLYSYLYLYIYLYIYIYIYIYI